MFMRIVFFTLLVFVSQVHAETENSKKTETAVFAGGCFWCMEHAFEPLEGVIKVISGFSGGTTKNPSYKQVSTGKTGHYEVIKIIYNPEKINYSQLINVFWHNIDPFNAKGQFCDEGSQYRAAIFYHSEEQRQQAQSSKQVISQQFKQAVATQIIAASPFFPAEDSHQHYYRINPKTYHFYRFLCGRDNRLKELWGK